MTSFDSTGKEIEALSPNAAQETGGNLGVLGANVPTQQDTLTAILAELRVHTFLLIEGLGLPYTGSELDSLRSQFTNSQR